MIKKFWDWLVKSSVDPEKTALTVKGILSGFIPVFVIVMKLLGVEVLTDELDAYLVILTTILSVSLTLFGLIRKLIITFLD